MSKMTTQYKESTDIVEIVQWINSGLRVEFQAKTLGSDWLVNTDATYINITDRKYRITIEPFEPEIGEEVLAGDRIYEFRIMDDDQYLCRNDVGAYYPFKEVKPLSDDGGS